MWQLRARGVLKRPWCINQLELQQLVQRQRKKRKVHENWEEPLWLLENIIRGTAVGEYYVRAGRGLVVSCVVDGRAHGRRRRTTGPTAARQ